MIQITLFGKYRMIPGMNQTRREGGGSPENISKKKSICRFHF